jgi:hypothetical protein
MFCRQGLAAWMRAWPRQAGNNGQVQKHPPSAITRSALPSSVCGQLVTVLAHMVLTARQEAIA